MLQSKRPYLLRCFYDWMVDSELTPHIIVDTTYPKVQVPREYIEHDGRIILNIGPQAVRGLRLTYQGITFVADFNLPVGEVQIKVPIHAVIGIYAEENKQEGVIFSPEDQEQQADPTPESLKNKPDFVVVE